MAIGGIFFGFGVHTGIEEIARTGFKANRFTRNELKLENGKSRAHVSFGISVRREVFGREMPSDNVEYRCPVTFESSHSPTTSYQQSRRVPNIYRKPKDSANSQ